MRRGSFGAIISVVAEVGRAALRAGLCPSRFSGWAVCARSFVAHAYDPPFSRGGPALPAGPPALPKAVSGRPTGRPHYLSPCGVRCPLSVGGVITLVWSCLRCRSSMTLVWSGLSCAAARFISLVAASSALPGRRGSPAACCAWGPRPPLVGSGGPRPFSPSRLPLVGPAHGGAGCATLGRAVAPSGRFFVG